MNIVKNIIETENNKTDGAIEKCVMCEGKTEYMDSVPINERNYYIEGAGQLCKKCYYNLYVKSGR